MSLAELLRLDAQLRGATYLPAASEGTRAMERRARRVGPFRLRRTKRDPGVAADLAPRQEQETWCELSREQVALPPEQRAAMAFAASAWGADASVGLFGWRATEERAEAPVARSVDASDERLDVAAVLPDDVVPARREPVPEPAARGAATGVRGAACPLEEGRCRRCARDDAFAARGRAHDRGPSRDGRRGRPP